MRTMRAAGHVSRMSSGTSRWRGVFSTQRRRAGARGALGGERLEERGQRGWPGRQPGAHVLGRQPEHGMDGLLAQRQAGDERRGTPRPVARIEDAAALPGPEAGPARQAVGLRPAVEGRVGSQHGREQRGPRTRAADHEDGLRGRSASPADDIRPAGPHGPRPGPPRGGAGVRYHSGRPWESSTRLLLPSAAAPIGLVRSPSSAMPSPTCGHAVGSSATWCAPTSRSAARTPCWATSGGSSTRSSRCSSTCSS